jgi:hypothetical protein
MKFRPRFSLRTLFVVISCLGVWLGWEVHTFRTIQERKEWLEHIVSKGATVTSSDDARTYGPPWPVPQISWLRRLLGDRAISMTSISVDEKDWERDFEMTKALFPEAVTSLHTKATLTLSS